MKSLTLGALLLAASGAFAAQVAYTYDDANRLVKVDYGDGRTISYTYDKSGNLLNRTVTSGEAAPAATSAAAKEGAKGGAKAEKTTPPKPQSSKPEAR